MTSGGDARATSTEAGLAAHRTLPPRRRLLDPWFRRAVLIALSVGVCAALMGTCRQHPVTSEAQGAVAGLSVQSPSDLRGGLIFQARFTVTARRALKVPV